MNRIDINTKKYGMDTFVLLPACCYNGNRFRVLKKDYPPMFRADETSVDMETTITDVPRLNIDGSGIIEVTTGDVSVPCIALWSKKLKKCFMVFTVQEINGNNLGLSYETGKISLIYPAQRTHKYVWPHMVENEEAILEEKVSDSVEIPYKIIEEACNSIEEFYELFFKYRKIVNLDDTLPKPIDKKEQIRVHIEKYNAVNWYEEKGFYGAVSKGDGGQPWGAGWTGGGISSYPLMKFGGPLEYERGMKTLEFLFDNQGASGLFYANATASGDVIHDGFGIEGTEGYTLIRRSADLLYFLFKHFDLMDTVPERFEVGAKKCAEAFVKLYNTYGQLGQFIDVHTGEIRVGGSASGGLAGAALISAYNYFGEEVYLGYAKSISEDYYNNYVSKGYTTGGPAEILQCPDSESAFALLESYVELFGCTKEEKWLDYAEVTAHLCSSWVVPYNYRFPEESEFYRLNMKTIGTIFANSQNKHSAPGICTLSGSSLIKLYEYTGDDKYYELYKEISTTISQYMSTDERPIFSWDVPKDPTVNKSTDIIVEREKLRSGYMCERVNMSDWETSRCIGGVFNGSCWPEVSNMLTLAEDREPNI